MESVRARVTAVDPVVRANRIFTCYDADGNGHLDMEEATRAFRQVGGASHEPARSDVGSVAARCPLRRWSPCRGAAISRDAVQATRELLPLQMVPDISDALVRAMFASADANGDGRVSREEFVAFVAPRLAHRTAAMGLAPTDALTGGNSGAGSSLFPSAAPSALTSASASIRTTPAASRWHSRPGSASRERALPLRP